MHQPLSSVKAASFSCDEDTLSCRPVQVEPKAEFVFLGLSGKVQLPRQSVTICERRSWQLYSKRSFNFINIPSPSVFIPLWQFGEAIDMESEGTRLVLLHWSWHT